MAQTTKAAKPPAETSAPPASPTPTAPNNKPVHNIRYRNIKAAIWMNEIDSGSYYTVTLSRSYQDDQKQWHDTNSFNTSDLPTLAKAVSLLDRVDDQAPEG